MQRQRKFDKSPVTSATGEQAALKHRKTEKNSALFLREPQSTAAATGADRKARLSLNERLRGVKSVSNTEQSACDKLPDRNAA